MAKRANVARANNSRSPDQLKSWWMRGAKIQGPGLGIMIERAVVVIVAVAFAAFVPLRSAEEGTAQEAADGMPVQLNDKYVIPVKPRGVMVRV